MDTKELVDKFVKGEITDEQFDAEKAKLSPEDLVKLNKEAESKLPDAVEKLKGVRRGIDKISAEKDASLATKLREENLASAKSEFFKKFGIEKTEDQASFMEGFKKFDSGNVTTDNIIKDMRAYYASSNADELLSLKEKQKEREIEAEEFNAKNGGSNSSGGGVDTAKKVSKEVKFLMEASAKAGRPMSAEQAERALKIAANKGRIS
jgi:hypothetical protein